MASGDFDCNCQPTRIASIKRCSPEDPHISLRKVVGLMEDPISAESYDRQVMILQDFIDASTYAFWVRDLHYIMKLIELLIERVDKVCVYRRPLTLLLSLCAVPPMLIRTSEALTYSRDIQEYFSFLGYLLIHLQDEELQDLVLRALSELLDRKVPVGNCCIKLKTCYTAVEESQLPNIISQLLEIVEENLYGKLLKISLTLANISLVVCQKMISEKVINHLLVRLDPSWKNRKKEPPPPDPEINDTIQNLESSSKLLWTLLSAFKHGTNEFKKSVAGPNLHALRSLRYALQVLVKQKENKLNRNHLMGILLQCLNFFPDMPLSQCGLIRDIGILSTATELGTGGTWAAQVRFSANETDYEFKKMLLLAVCYCAKHSNIIKDLQPKRVLPAMLKIVTPELNMMWHPQQHSKLISLSLHTLQLLALHLPNEFVYYDGLLRLLMLIDCFSVEQYDTHILRDCLKSLNLIVITENQDILNNVLVNGGYSTLKRLCENLLSTETLTLMKQRCLAYAFSTLELLCKTQCECEPSAVTLCMKFLKRVVRPNAEDPVYDSKFLICAVTYLWEVVVWYKNSLQLFLSEGGVFVFLDFIQKSAFPVKLVALSALVDMCYEGTCVPYLITWRKNGQTILSMLLELFRDENLKLGVKTTPSGTIKDIETPIMGYHQWYKTYYENKELHSSPATIDLIGSCRPKVYALIQLLSIRHEIRTDIANEHYCMYDNNNLSTQDQITLLLAENFLALKLGEGWIEVYRDMEKSGIRLLAIDQEIIALLTHRFRKWALHIKTVQEALLKEEKKKDGINERLLYNTLKESKLVESLKALHQLDYIARTTERMFRLIRKMKQNTELESLPFTDGTDHHRTFMYKIKVNPVFNQQVSIQSNTIVDPNNEDFDLRPVSPESETNSCGEFDETKSNLSY